MCVGEREKVRVRDSFLINCIEFCFSFLCKFVFGLSVSAFFISLFSSAD